jgi:hypothetical protein
VTLFFAGRGLLAELRRVRELTEIRHEEDADRMISEGTEDGISYPHSDTCFYADGVFFCLAIKLETLQKLCESSSFDLRSAYGILIFNRSDHSADHIPELFALFRSGQPRDRREIFCLKISPATTAENETKPSRHCIS